MLITGKQETCNTRDTSWSLVPKPAPITHCKLLSQLKESSEKK